MNLIRRSALGLLSAFAFSTFTVPGIAQTDNPISTKQASELELERVRKILADAEERQSALKAEITALDKDIEAINRALLTASKRGQDLEGDIATIEEQLDISLTQQSELRTSLASKSDLLAEVIGALQRMGSKPPPALLVTPEDAIASIRSSMVLGLVVPVIRDETAILLAELTALRETSRKIEQQKASLTEALNALAEDEARLSLLIDEKNTLLAGSREALDAEAQKAAKLASQATSLQGLIIDLETQIESAAAAADAARKADENRRRLEEERLIQARKTLQSNGTSKIDRNNNALASLGPSSGDVTRIEPAVAFSKALGALPRPAQGVQLYDYDSRSSIGTTNKNIALAVRANARVRSPADGWVVYAGPFRSYGQILILNAGDGYHVILSGLAQVNVPVGRFVLAGEPVGRMGITRVASAAPLKLGSNGPVLYVEFRKNGKPIDPTPWWSIPAGEGPKDDS